MLERAIYLYDVDVANSYFVGDSTRDVEAALKVGLNAIKVTSNSNLSEYEEDVQ